MRALRKRIASLAGSMGYYVGKIAPTTDSLGSHLGMLFDVLEINCVIDVGAHTGEYGQLVANTGYSGRLVSYEPVLENFNELSKVADSAGNWTAVHCALGDSDGQMEINVTESTAIASFLTPNEYAREQFGGKSAVKRTELVDVRRLDSVFSDCVAGIPDPRVYLKMDTQGYDLRVLEGAHDCLGQVLAIQSELSVRKIYEGMPDFTEAITRFNSLGFELSAIFPVTIDRNLRMIEFDCVAVR